MNPFNTATNFMATALEMPRGLMSQPAAVQPVLMLELYEMENCPFCRVVREVLTQLDLDAMIYPCPKGGKRYRPKVVKMGGKALFPFLVDPNTGTQLYESTDIIKYLFETYAQRPAPSALRVKVINSTAASVISALRGRKGLDVRAAKRPAKPLELWSFESSPYARPVRELLCEMEIAYKLHNIGRTSAQDFVLPAVRNKVMPDYEVTGRNRVALKARAGSVQSPYLYDPNTDKGMFESADIMAYLKSQYAK